MDDNMELAGKNPFDSPKFKTPLGITSVFDFNVDSGGFAMEDFGRESLGIIDINHPDFRRDSLSFIYDPRKEDFGRESLGIINLNDEWKSKDLLRVSQITVNDSSSNATSSLLNTAFILPADDSVFSFNSNSLGGEAPSTIFSMSSGSSLFNEAFVGSCDFFKQLFSQRYLNLMQPHQRIKSLPSELKKTSDEAEVLVLEELREKRKTKSEAAGVGLNSPEKEDKFDDSVFLEANHLAHKVAHKLDLDEGDILDRTQEPADFMIEVSEDDESMKCDTETVFKTVDKLLPPVIISHNIKTSFKNNESSASNNKSNNSSRDPRDIINSLSELLNKVSPTEQQKTAGQNLLSSLAEIINGNSPFSNNLDDSGHSSSESDLMTSQNNECYEVLDLRKKSSSESSVSQTESCEVCVPLDLSIKSSKSVGSEKGMSPRILPLKFSNSSQQRLIKGNSIGSNCSVSSNENKSGSEVRNKFKPRKVEEKVNVKKGPLKAVIPVSNMARRKSIQVTPTRTELQSSKYSQKKTSTPINKFNVKPMAQSTPEGVRSAISPLKIPNSSPKTTKQRLNYSGPGSPHNKSSHLPTSSFVRRHSVSDMKQSQTGLRLLKRSNSMGEGSKVKVTAVAVKQNIAKAAKRNSVSNKSVLLENRNKSMVKPPEGKRIGKENVR